MSQLAVSGMLLLALFALSGQAVPSTKSLTGIEVGGFFYFSDTASTLRTQAEAVKHCNDQGADLAIVPTYSIYNRLRVALSIAGTYWIDGKEKEDVSRFDAKSSCNAPALDFTGFPEANLRLTSRSCLALVKTATASTSRIEALDCGLRNRVVCAFDLNDCPTTTASPTTTSP